jgi:ribose 5-phosphate isomerase B
MIAIGNDHAGTQLKFEVKEFLEELGYKIRNYGTDSGESVDYPDYVHPVTQSLEEGKAAFGILICGSAQGVSMAANKYKGIRAAVCWDSEIAVLSRKHNDANVLCLPARFLTEKNANKIALVFLQTAFEGGRHLKRIEKIGLKAS